MNGRSREWLETMLSYATNLLSQADDVIALYGKDALAPTTGPENDPDKYDIHGFLREVRKSYPRF